MVCKREKSDVHLYRWKSTCIALMVCLAAVLSTAYGALGLSQGIWQIMDGDGETDNLVCIEQWAAIALRKY